MYKIYTNILCWPHRHIPKTLLVMKLTAVLLFAAMMQVSATSLAQRITLKEQHVSVKKIFKVIRQQTGYDVIFQPDKLNTSITIDADFKDTPLAEVIQKCIAGEPLSYTIINKTIVIKPAVPVINEKKQVVADTVVVGNVVGEGGMPLVGATVTVKSTSNAVSTDDKGTFAIEAPSDGTLIISFIGYKHKEIAVRKVSRNVKITLEATVGQLESVTVVNTGYQDVWKERATGSFEQVDNKLFNRTTSSRVLDRLDGVVSGLSFNKTQDGRPRLRDMSIRGLGTLTPEIGSPLVIVDSFPYEGDVNDINPNDVESVTVLKDAAAASIWGAKAGNGVVVITTKKGKYNRPLQVSFNSNISVKGKPDLFYAKAMKSSDYIDLETDLFKKGNYDYQIGDNTYYSIISPVVQLLADARSGAITQASADEKINALRNVDVRNDYLKYIFRKQVTQQYALNLNGGTQDFNYVVSGGYDKDLQNIVKNNDDRLTFRSDMFFRPVKKLELEAGITYTQSGTNTIGSRSFLNYTPFMVPYTQFADAEGNPLAVARKYKLSFEENPGDPRLLDWTYKPLNELNASKNTIRNENILINLGAKYTISSVLSASLKYEYTKLNGKSVDWEGLGAYVTRDLINNFTQPVGSPVEHPLPVGGLLNNAYTTGEVHDYRFQLNADKAWKNSQFTAIAGVDVNQRHVTANSNNVYGYDANTLTSQNVNFNEIYTPYINNYINPEQISSGISMSEQLYRFTSYYANAAYTYNNRYTVSLSARKDASNLFGVKTNQRGVPLWSAGLSWNIDRESFYNSGILPSLRLRVTYGYGGNTNNGLSAYSIIVIPPFNNSINLPFAYIKNPANDALRWERVGQLNLGLDFGFKNNVVTGTLEYYKKHSTDVISLAPLDFTTGFGSTSLNNAEIKGTGVDLQLHSNNLAGAFKWRTDFLFSYNINKVTKYTQLNALLGSALVTSGYSITPVVGRPTQAIYSYKWAGLDPQTGAPRGYVDGKISEDYAAITNARAEDMQYSGPAVPVYFGTFRNSFGFKRLEVSASVRYELGYYFRREGFNYSGFAAGAGGVAEYVDRWRKPGDELHTNVPAFIYPVDGQSDSFYTRSAALVDKADNIRLQDITLSYTPANFGHYFKNIRFYANVANLGILWRANKHGIDPDYGINYPDQKTFTIGFNAAF